MFFAFFSLVVSENNQMSIEAMSFPSSGNLVTPLVLMIISLLLLFGFYGYHLRRIMKDITSVSPVFDIAETETKIDFTIAERGASN